MKSSSSKLSSNKFKAIIFDVDGTIMFNKKKSLPSKKVTEAIINVSQVLHVGIATSRHYSQISHITSHLKLKGPSIYNVGATVADAFSGKVLWEKTINLQDLVDVHKIATSLNLSFLVNTDLKHVKCLNPKKIKKPLALWFHALEERLAEKLIKSTSHLPNIVVYKLPSWKKGKIDLSINHLLATKKHATEQLAKLLKIKTNEIIGVGDGYNDIPLLSACGLKIAMGNAVPELKAIADYVAPSVEEDGVVDIINKFIF